jgi:hypothetical protein
MKHIKLFEENHNDSMENRLELDSNELMMFMKAIDNIYVYFGDSMGKSIEQFYNEANKNETGMDAHAKLEFSGYTSTLYRNRLVLKLEDLIVTTKASGKEEIGEGAIVYSFKDKKWNFAF